MHPRIGSVRRSRSGMSQSFRAVGLLPTLLAYACLGSVFPAETDPNRMPIGGGTTHAGLDGEYGDHP